MTGERGKTGSYSDCLGEIFSGARQPAHHRSDRYPENAGCLPVGKVLDADQENDFTLIVRQIGDRMGNAVQGKACFDISLARGADEVLPLLNVLLRTGRALLSNVVNPQISQDLEQPRIKTGSRFKALDVGKRAFASRLHQVVGKIAGTAKGNRKTAQVRKKCNKLLSELISLSHVEVSGFLSTKRSQPPPHAFGVGRHLHMATYDHGG